MDKYYFTFLEMFKDRMVYYEINITDYVKMYFLEKKWADPWDQIRPLREVVDDELKPLTKSGHFIVINNTDIGIQLGRVGWIDCLDVKIQISPGGVLFLYEKKKIDETVRGNNLTYKFIIATFIIGILNIGATLISSYMQNTGQKTIVIERIMLNKNSISNDPLTKANHPKKK